MICTCLWAPMLAPNTYSLERGLGTDNVYGAAADVPYFNTPVPEGFLLRAYRNVFSGSHEDFEASSRMYLAYS